jgi:hypothetical protein
MPLLVLHLPPHRPLRLPVLIFRNSSLKFLDDRFPIIHPPSAREVIRVDWKAEPAPRATIGAATGMERTWRKR